MAPRHLRKVQQLRIRVFHWRAEEAKPLLTVLEAAGYSVDYKEPVSSYREVRLAPPDAIVIDLSRLPSHGREVAVFLRGSKATRHVPIVFVGGEAEKIEGVRRVLPDAFYTPMSHLRGALRNAIANPPADPLKPAQMMERWGTRTTAQKLGIAKDSRVFVIDPPSGYARAIGELPEGAYFEEESPEGCAVSLWFVHGIAEFQAALPRMRALAARSRLWILWRKSKQDGLNGNVIRAGCVDVGLVDYKICSINETWSAMVFAIKKAR
jgi:CheY-like chemotaxis protein